MSDAGAPDGVAGVLVAEDDVVLAALLADTLTELGHRVAVAHNGAEALRVVAAGRPACILLNLHLPVMDGAAFVAAYRTHFQTQPRVQADTSGWSVLAVLADGQEKTHAQVIAGCHLVFAEDRVPASTFSRALHRLEDLGLVERYRP